MKIVLLLLLMTLGCLSEERKVKSEIKMGVLDLTHHNFQAAPFLSLEGEWKFFYDRLPSEISASTHSTFLKLPAHWNQVKIEGVPIKGQGVGTFRLKIILPTNKNLVTLALLTGEQDTSHAIYVGGVFLGGSGIVGKTLVETTPQVRSSLVILPTSKETKEVEIDLVIANFSHRKGGPWNDVIIAPYFQAQERLTNKKMNEAVISSILAFVSIFFFVFYFFDRKASHALGIFAFSFIIFLRNISTGERILLDWVNLPYAVILRIEYLSWFWSAPLLTYYFQSVFPKDFSLKVTTLFYFISVILSLGLALPPVYFTEIASVYPIIFILNGCFVLYSLTKSYINKRSESRLLLAGTLILLIGSVNDTLHAEAVIHTTYIGPLAVVCFIFLQVFTFGSAVQDNINKLKEMAQNLISINKSYSRFVPKEFLNFLGKQDIRELDLGEQVQKNMTVMFADIRSFTEMSENLTPKESFDFLNSYLLRVGPIIRRNHGFIDKFIGDAIMALFPQHANDAITAAVQMQSEIRKFNEERAKSDLIPIRVGIGIHTGYLMLGILGEHERMEGTVISDAVNLASRIEGLTKVFGAEIIISADTFIDAGEHLGFEYRLLDSVPVKGKRHSVYIVEVLDGYETEKREALLNLKEDYTLALEAYRRGAYTEARSMFLNILNACPQDNVSRVFLTECDRFLNLEKVDT